MNPNKVYNFITKLANVNRVELFEKLDGFAKNSEDFEEWLIDFGEFKEEGDQKENELASTFIGGDKEKARGFEIFVEALKKYPPESKVEGFNYLMSGMYGFKFTSGDKDEQAKGFDLLVSGFNHVGPGPYFSKPEGFNYLLEGLIGEDAAGLW